MQKLALYISYKKGKKQISLTPPEVMTDGEIWYQISPDEGKILENTKTLETSRGLVIPAWKLDRWIEKDINN